MTKDTAHLSNEDFAARMRARRGVLPKSDSTVEPIPKPRERVPMFEPEPVEETFQTVQCCSSQRLLKKPHKKGAPTGLYRCTSCGAVQYDPSKCHGTTYRGTGRTQSLLTHAIQKARGDSPLTIYFVAHDNNYAEALADRVCDSCQEDGSFFKGRERREVYFHNGGRIKFVSCSWIQGQGFRGAVSDLVIYDHYQAIHKT